MYLSYVASEILVEYISRLYMLQGLWWAFLYNYIYPSRDSCTLKIKSLSYLLCNNHKKLSRFSCFGKSKNKLSRKFNVPSQEIQKSRLNIIKTGHHKNLSNRAQCSVQLSLYITYTKLHYLNVF